MACLLPAPGLIQAWTPANVSKQQALSLPLSHRGRAALGLGIRALGVSFAQAGLPRASMGRARRSSSEDCGWPLSLSGSQFPHLEMEEPGQTQ